MSKRIPSYRQHRPSGQAVVTLNGRDHYLVPGNHLSAAPNTIGSFSSGWPTADLFPTPIPMTSPSLN